MPSRTRLVLCPGQLPDPCPTLTICDTAPFDSIYAVTFPKLPAVLSRPRSAVITSLEGTLEAVTSDDSSTGGVGVWLFLVPSDGMTRYVRWSRSLALRVNGRDYLCTNETNGAKGFERREASRGRVFWSSTKISCPIVLEGKTASVGVWNIQADGTHWLVTDSIVVK